MGKNKVLQLTNAYFKMMASLREGYPTHSDKLKELFFDIDDLPEAKLVITKYFESTKRDPASTTQTHSKRIKSRRMFSGRTTVMVVYPKSGAVYEGRVRYNGDKCMIEPIKRDRAFWIIDRKYMESDEIVDLNIIPFKKKNHTKGGRAMASEFR